MTVRDLPEPQPSEWSGAGGTAGPDMEALLLAWSEALKHEARADELVAAIRVQRDALEALQRELATLRQAAHVLGATSRLESMAALARDLFRDLVKGRACALWCLGEQAFEAKVLAGVDHPRAALELPAPNPFPDLPILLGQWQVLERTDLPAPLPMVLSALGDRPLYVPFEFQGLLVGFLLVDARCPPAPMSGAADALELLQLLFAGAFFQAWNQRDLQRQRERLRTEGAEMLRRMEGLARENRALSQGQGHRMEFLGFALDQLRPIFAQLMGTLTRLRQDFSVGAEDRGNLLLEGLLQGKRMAEFLRDLTEMARPGRSAASLVPLPVDLGGLLAQVRPVVEAFPRAEDGTIDWPDLTDLPEILASAESLHLVLTALCEGATRLHPKGDLHLWVEREPLHLAIRLLLEGFQVEPADPGLHRRGSIQPSELYARGQSGASLGLVIAEHLVKAMGGNLRLDRDFFGQGTVVSLEFPLA